MSDLDMLTVLKAELEEKRLQIQEFKARSAGLAPSTLIRREPLYVTVVLFVSCSAPIYTLSEDQRSL